MLGLTEMIIILVVIVLFFGAKKLPELGKALGRTAKEFKKGLSETDEIDVTESSRRAQLKNETEDNKETSE